MDGGSRGLRGYQQYVIQPHNIRYADKLENSRLCQRNKVAHTRYIILGPYTYTYILQLKETGRAKADS